MTTTLFDTPRPAVPRPVLSENATRVWTVLRNAGATSEQYAMTDSQIAAAASLNHRHIVDAAKELLECGVLALAGSTGRWIGTVPEALAYADRIRSRGREMFDRVRAIKRGIALHQRQLSLFNQEPQP